MLFDLAYSRSIFRPTHLWELISIRIPEFMMNYFVSFFRGLSHTDPLNLSNFAQPTFAFQTSSHTKLRHVQYS